MCEPGLSLGSHSELYMKTQELQCIPVQFTCDSGWCNLSPFIVNGLKLHQSCVGISFGTTLQLDCLVVLYHAIRYKQMHCVCDLGCH